MVKSAHRGRGALLSLVLALVAALSVGRAEAAIQAYYYDAAGRLTGVVDGANGTAIYTLDGAGNVLSVTEKPITTLIVGGFVPATGAAGTSVTIGGNFAAATTSNTTVKFNSVVANVTAVSATKLTVTVPSGATTGPVSVTVGSSSYTTGLNFTVPTATAAPTITSFSPTLVAPGSTVTVTGTNFSTTNSLVYVNNFVMAVNSATSTTLTFTVPPGATTGHITVETPAGKVASANHLFIPPQKESPGYYNGYQSNWAYSISQVAQTIEGALGQGSTVNANSTGGNVALIAVDVPANQYIGARIGYSPQFYGVGNNLGLYNPNGTLGATGSPLSPEFYTASPVDATALIVVYAAGDSVVASTVTPFAAPAPVTATIQANGQPNTIVINPNNDVTLTGQAAHLQFAGNQGSQAALLIQPSSGSGPCVRVRVIAPDGFTQIYDSMPNCINGPIDSQAALSLPQSGNYTIDINYYYGTGDSGNGQYPLTLKVTVFTPAAPLTGTTSYGAGPVAFTFTTPGQVAEYTFPAMPGDTISWMTEPNSNDTQQCYVAWLMNPAPDGTASITNGGTLTSNAGSGISCGAWSVKSVQLPSAGLPGSYGAGTALANGPWTYTMYVVPALSGSTAQVGTFDFAVYNPATPAKCPRGGAPPCALSNNTAMTIPITAAGQTVEASFVGNGKTATLTVSGDSNVSCLNMTTSGLSTLSAGQTGTGCGPFSGSAVTTLNQVYNITITAINVPIPNNSTHLGVGNITLKVAE